ncbi:hypothetical protein [Parasphingorhabdus sp.]|uniref:hypothetical protein n=1 Tax=Parasphingorhabdus sp. TaxID=2709688 RepID=UPI003D293411
MIEDLDIEEIVVRLGDNDILLKLEIYQMIIRKWAQHLTTQEIAILMQIVDQTVGWGKLSERIYSDKLLNGGNLYGGQSGISRSYLFKVLKSLESKGMISRNVRRRASERATFTVNVKWTSPTDG